MTATMPIKATAAMSSTTENPRMFTMPIPNRGGHYRRGRLNVKRTHLRNLLGKIRLHDRMTLYFFPVVSQRYLNKFKLVLRIDVIVRYVVLSKQLNKRNSYENSKTQNL